MHILYIKIRSLKVLNIVVNILSSITSMAHFYIT